MPPFDSPDAAVMLIVGVEGVLLFSVIVMPVTVKRFPLFAVLFRSKAVPVYLR
jgi:hypothetical protein